MNRKILLGIATLMLAALACSTLSMGTNRVVGSGHLVSESRTVANFTAVDVQGSADVTVALGNSASVIVQADDNIVPMVETSVQNGTLVIGMKPATNITSFSPIRVTVTVKSMNLDALGLSGSGSLKVSGMSGPDLSVQLSGSGGITVDGSVDHVSIKLPGSGNVHCEGLKAKSANVTLLGSGNIYVYASESLDASIVGSGTIRYTGNPAQVTKNVSGSGVISP